MYHQQEEHQVLHHQVHHQVDGEQLEEIKMNNLDKYIPENLVGTIKDNYIHAFKLVVKGNRYTGRFLLFMAPILLIEALIVWILGQLANWKLGINPFDLQI